MSWKESQEVNILAMWKLLHFTLVYVKPLSPNEKRGASLNICNKCSPLYLRQAVHDVCRRNHEKKLTLDAIMCQSIIKSTIAELWVHYTLWWNTRSSVFVSLEPPVFGFLRKDGEPADVTYISLWGWRPSENNPVRERMLMTKGGRAAKALCSGTSIVMCGFIFDVSIF